MASLGQMLARWGPTILKNLPHIVLAGGELYRVYRTVRDSKEESESVNKAMELLKEYRDDIDRLREDRKQMVVLLEGLTILMERLTQHYGSHGSHHFPPSHCCQHAMDPPCCHHHHGPRGPSGCHNSGPRGPSPPDCHHKDPKRPLGCSCSAHVEMPQSLGSLWQELSDDEDYGTTSCESSSNGDSWRVCHVCRNDYNVTNRRPTILICGHTFCRECLGQVARHGSLLCPTCRTHERRPPAALPPNVVLMIALEEEGQKRNRTKNNGNEDNWEKNSTLLLEEEQVLMQMALHLSMKNGAENKRDEDDWKKNVALLQEEEEVLMEMALHLSLESEVACGAKLDSEHEPQDNGNIHTVMKIKDSCIKIEKQIKDNVLPKVGSISLGLVEAQQCRKVLMRLRKELMEANEHFMCHLEQLDCIAFQDTDTQGRQSRKILVKKILNLMDQYEGMEENINQLMQNYIR